MINPVSTLASLLAGLWLAFATDVQATEFRVVTDIAPVHSLISQVMGDTGAPQLLMEGNASPHDFTLRPSMSAKIARADMVFRVSPELTPWLQTALHSLAPDTAVVSLAESDATVLMPVRTRAEFESHQHDADDDHPADPHAWLDPKNALVWLDVIAEALSTGDPENASRYQSNAQSAKADLLAIIERIDNDLAALPVIPIAVFHDSIQYFEQRFDLRVTASIISGDAAQPGPARIEGLRRLFAKQQVECVLIEPQFNTKLINAVASSGSINTVEMDVLGVRLDAGPGLYNKLMLGLAESIKRCHG